MMKTLLGLAMAAAMLGATAARADWNDGNERRGRHGRQGWRHQHDGHACDLHHAVPVQPSWQNTAQQGRYEQREVQTWVEGRYDQVYVAPVCTNHHRHWRQRCTAGGYQSVWVPGRYETRQEWVWVAWSGHQAGQVQLGVSFR